LASCRLFIILSITYRKKSRSESLHLEPDLPDKNRLRPTPWNHFGYLRAPISASDQAKFGL
jgi:hypothetical protein